MRENAGQLGLAEYYLITGLNAYGTTLFFLGVFFHARLLHGFSDTANLLLAATQGGAYVLASRAGGRFADRVGTNRSVVTGLAGMCLALVFGWQATQSWALFAALALYSASTALTWPAIEAALAHAPGRVPLARHAGLFNVTWSLVGSAGFFAAGAIFTRDPEAVFWAPLAAHTLEIAWIAIRSVAPPRPAALPHRDGTLPFCISGGNRHGEGVARRGGLHRADRREHDGGPQRQDPAACTGTAGAPKNALSPGARARFLKSAWIANGLSYFLYGAFAALSPTLGERLGLGPRLTIWLVSTYLFTRSASFVLFWRWGGWEYSRGWLAASLALPPAAFVALFFIPSPQAAIGALAVLGAMSGLAYSASLHSSLDREGGKGEGGGLHEWVIGLGILLGPFAGVAGERLLGGIAGAGGLVAILGALATVAGLTLLRRASPDR
ncbi:MAG: MFS transporter [Candidatus Methylomirabilia bacterium]